MSWVYEALVLLLLCLFFGGVLKLRCRRLFIALQILASVTASSSGSDVDPADIARRTADNAARFLRIPHVSTSAQ